MSAVSVPRATVPAFRAALVILLLLFAPDPSLGRGGGGHGEAGATPLDYHAEAMARVNAGDYRGALPFFQLACRLDPSNAGFWNDLGVTEMRLGELHKSKTRFLKATEISPDFSVGYDNIQELRTHMGDEAFNAGLKRRPGDGKPVPIEHHVEEPPNFSAEEFYKITVQDDVRDWRILGDAPIVVRGAAQAWGWSLDALGLQGLTDEFGSERVDYYPHNMQTESVHPYFSPLADAIEALEAPMSVFEHVDVSEPGTYIQWNVLESAWRRLLTMGKITLPDVFDDSHWTKECFQTLQDQNKFNINLHWKMLLIGEAGAGMFNHKDVLRMASWQVQLAGRKKWHICSPSQDEFLSVYMNVLYPDYASWPQLRNASCFTTIVETGDMLYYPRDWWHQTENLDTPTIALSGSMVNQHNHLEFTDELRKECSAEGSGRNRIFIPEAGACGDIERCAAIWVGMYSGVESSPGPPPRDEL